MMTNDHTNFTVQSEYYYIGQFSRFIRPGAVRLGSSAWTGNVEVTAFENRDGGRTAVVLNRTEKETVVSITENMQEAWNFVMAPHSIATLSWK